jgi:glycosyltransferase involved in cell wall biosynthesis
MKVCFVSNATELGGAERVLLETIDVLKERGIECRVLLPGDGELAQEFGEAGVPYAFLDGGSWVSWERPSPWNQAKAVAKIAGRLFPAVRTIRGWGCDAIYSNSVTVCGGAVVARLLNLPHIWHLHEFGKEYGMFYKFGEGFSNRSIGRLSSACILVSNDLAAKYGQFIAPSKLRVVYPSMHRGLSSGEYSGTQSTLAPAFAGRFRLVIVGGLVEGKGHADAVQALAHLVREGVNAELLIVGESYPAFRGTLEEIARSNALSGRVSFVGRVRDASPFLRAADVVLVCSRGEAFGRVTIEAMLAGKAVVGAAAGATVELVQDGFNGLLYKCGDPADLAAKVRFLVDHPAIVQRLGQNGKRWAASRFTRERYGEELMAVLSSVVRAPSLLPVTSQIKVQP